MKNLSVLRKMISTLTCIALCMFDVQGWSEPVFAAGNSISVNDRGDTVVGGDGRCTLREAIRNAELSGDSTRGDCASGGTQTTIIFAPSLNGQVITLSSVDDVSGGPSAFAISKNVTISGDSLKGIVLERSSGVNDMRLFYVKSSGSLTLNNLTLRNGVAKGGKAGNRGGGAAGFGGAIYSAGNLIVSGVTLTNNSAKGGDGGSALGNSGGGGGGGLGGNGQMSPYDQSNLDQRLYGNGGLPNDYSKASSGRTGDFGGGGYGGYGAHRMSGSAYPGGNGGFGGGGGGGGNNPNGCGGNGGAGGFGGGGGGAGGTNIKGYCFPDSKYAKSGAGGFGAAYGAGFSEMEGGGGAGGAGMGGAIFQYGGTVTLTNSTLSGNKANGGNPGGSGLGGAIFIYQGTVNMITNTIAFNENGSTNSGALYNYQGTFNLSNNIIASNVNGDVYKYGSSSISGSNNVIPASTGVSAGVILSTADPNLGALADNKGPAYTHAISVGSPAIDAGNAVGAPITDQRGFSRDTTPDIGAYEYAESAASASILSGIGTSVTKQAVTFTIQVTSRAPWLSQPGGIVEVKAGSENCSASLSAGRGSCSIAFPSAGDYKVSATYLGDVSFAGTTSIGGIHRVNKAGTLTRVSAATPNSVLIGQAVNISVTVAAVPPESGTPSGAVTVSCQASLVDGAGNCSLTFDSIGKKKLTATYGGNGAYNGSSNYIMLEVNKPATTTTISGTSPNPSVTGQPVIVSVAVAAASGSGTPTGTVTLKDGTSVQGEGTLSGGAAIIVVNSLKVGAQALTAVYNGNANFAVSTSAPFAQTVQAAGTTTALSSSMTQSKYGQAVTFTANVAVTAPGSGTPTGTVMFKDGSTVLRIGRLNGSGNATIDVSDLTAGTHSITAQYGGDGNYVSSTSAALTQTVSAASTAISLASSSNPSVSGQTVMLTATVMAVSPSIGTPTGTVKFKYGGKVLGEETLSGGAATLVVEAWTVGVHHVTAEYGGSTDYRESGPFNFTQTVNKVAGNVVLSSSSNPSVSGQPLILTATVTAEAPGSGMPSGTVTFKNGETVLGIEKLDNGVATIEIVGLALITHRITAEYGGSSDFEADTSNVLEQTVHAANTTTMVASSKNPSGSGEHVTLTATVTAVAPGSGMPTGKVTFKDGTVELGAAELSNGKASFETADLASGNRGIVAEYAGNSEFKANTSAVFVQKVDTAVTTTELTSSENTSKYGQPVTLTATVSVVDPGSGMPTGKVTFKDGAVELGTGTLINGTATLTTLNLTAAAHSITAEYKGSDDYAVSKSEIWLQTVEKASTSTSLLSSVTASVYGEPVIFTATVASIAPGSGTPTGMVTFKDGTIVLGTIALNSSGTAILTLSSLGAGIANVSATYIGDDGYTTSLSAEPVSVTVSKATVETTISGSGSTSVVGEPVTFTARVTAMAPSIATPEGTVTFKEGATVLGTGILNGGVATFTTSAFAVGTYGVTAEYGTNGNYETSVSVTPAPITVLKSGTHTDITASVASAVFGENIEFTIRVTAVSPGGGVPTGAVSIKNGTEVLKTGELDHGTATIQLASLAVNDYSITAEYDGNGNYEASTAENPAVVKIQKAATETTLLGSPTSVVFSKEATLTAKVSAKAPGSGLPSGEVIFKSDGNEIGTRSLDSSGQAVLKTTSLALGNHLITAEYDGKDFFLGSVSSEHTIAIIQNAAAFTLSSSVTEAVYGQPVTLRAAVTSNDMPTGEVIFKNGEMIIGTTPLNEDGEATYILENLALGDHSFSASYSGDDMNKPGYSSQVPVKVNPAKTTTTLPVTRVVHNQPFTIMAKVEVKAPGIGVPAGDFNFQSEQELDLQQTGTLNESGEAAVTIGPLPIGSYTLMGTYVGNSFFEGSSTSILVQVYDPVSTLELDAYEYTLKPGAYHTTVVTAVYGPTDRRDVTAEALYSSSDTAVAVVDDHGRVEAVGEGASDITVSYGNYTVKARITVQLSANASLSALTLSEGTLKFDPDTLKYNITVDSNVSKLRVSARATDEGSTVQIHETAPTIGSASAELILTTENTVIAVKVTAPDGRSVRRYELNVTKRSSAPSPDPLPGTGTSSPPNLNPGTGKGSRPEESKVSWRIPLDSEKAGIVGVLTQVVGSGDRQIVKISEKDLYAKLSSTQTPHVYTILIPTGNQKFRVELSTSMLAQIHSKNSDNSIGLSTEKLDLELPLRWFTPEAISDLLGVSVKDAEKAILSIDVEERKDIVVPNAIVTPIDISINVVIDGNIVGLNQLNGNYLKRAIEIPDSVNSKFVVGVAIGKDGKMYPVPTEVISINGKKVAILQADHQAVFTVITNTADFTDIGNSWANAEIRRLGNKMVVSGYPDGSFLPMENVSRAEFITILARSLGMPVRNRISETSNYTDVGKDDWYFGSIAPMVNAGIITGYEDGTFRGDKNINREEAVVLLTRAVEYIKLGTDRENAGRLSSTTFADLDQVSSYARGAIDSAQRRSLIKGYADGTFRPQVSMNRAEAVMMISNLWKSVHFTEQ